MRVADNDDGYTPPPPDYSEPPPPPPDPNPYGGDGDYYSDPPNPVVEVNTTNESDSPPPLRGPDSPFAIFADIAQNALGGARQQQAPTLVPVSTSGGIGAGALLIVLALIGGAVWFYFRQKKGASDAS